MKKLALFSGWIFALLLVAIIFFGWNYTNSQLQRQSDNFTRNYATLNAVYESLRTDYNNLAVSSANMQAYYASYITALNASFDQQRLQWTDTLNNAMTAKDAAFAVTLNNTLNQQTAYWNAVVANSIESRDAMWKDTLNAAIVANNQQWQQVLNQQLTSLDAQWRNWIFNNYGAYPP